MFEKRITKKATAVAPANIALIKFMGKTDEKLRLPANSSLSFCLSQAVTRTTVEFSPFLKNDEVIFSGADFAEKEKKRVIDHLKRIRKKAKSRLFAKVMTKNTFPKSSGIASSASGFAALTLAAISALELSLSTKELSILARIASGSACRSIPGGFVEWRKGRSSSTSYAYSLYPPDYWDLVDILVVVSTKAKAVSTTKAHQLVTTSPYYQQRIAGIENKIKLLKRALAEKNFPLLGQITEEEALNMHAVLMTAQPSVFYWTEETIGLMQSVWQMRQEKLPVYFTIDAGANIHLLTQEKDSQAVISFLEKRGKLKNVMINRPSLGARLSQEHLF